MHSMSLRRRAYGAPAALGGAVMQLTKVDRSRSIIQPKEIFR
jgi:hypothetical protein